MTVFAFGHPGAWVRWLVVAVGILSPAAVDARVVRFEVAGREPFAGGEAFDEVGPYERIVGKVHFAIDPELRQNQAIIDLRHAPRNSDGLVEFSSDLFLLAPRDLTKANGAVLYGVNNRGRKLSLQFFNDAPLNNNPRSLQDAGNGFLFRHGFVVLWSGWDGELLPDEHLLRLYAPFARGKEGPITGMVRYQTGVKEPTDRMNINASRDNHGAYRPTPEGLKNAVLTWRMRPGDRRAAIPREQFRLEVQDIQPLSPGQLPRIELVVPAGLRPGYLYEVIYEAQDPLVHGVCFASVRDLVSALVRGEGKDNPLLLDGKPAVRRAHGFGVSQSGRFLREFVHAGFNEDEQGRRVFDGLVPHVAGGGLGSFNHRFAQPTAFVTQHELHDFCTDRFPFAYEEQKDPLEGRADGILRRSSETKTEPLIMHTQSTAEYWTRSGSLPHTDPLGRRDAQVPENVRFYSFGGTQHGASPSPPQHGLGQQLNNPADYRPLLRALLLALDRWAKEGVEPPPSVYPKLSDGTLADWDQASTGFPPLPGVRYPEVIQQPAHLDFGKRWLNEGIMDNHPPQVRGPYRVLVPRCDADGNERGCLLPPEVAVPLATYTGWNLRRRAAGAENELVGLVGSYIPLPPTEEHRLAAGDPRPSIAQRYGSRDDYLARLKSHCGQMVEAGYLLEEDVPTIIDRLSQQFDAAMRDVDVKRSGDSARRKPATP